MLLHTDQAVLLAIDYQERIMRAMAQSEELCAAGLRLCQGAQLLGLPLLYTEQYPEGLGASREDFQAIYTQMGGRGFAKKVFNALALADFSQALDEQLGMGRKQFILAGVEAHICVRQTALALLDRGLEVYVAADACSSRRLEHRDWAYQELRQLGARLCSVESLLYELLGGAEHPQFKATAKLIK